MSSNKPKTSSKATTNDESNASSTLSIQKLIREAEAKKEASTEATRTRCKTCFKEIAPKRMCGGHGSGGGGGSGSDNVDTPGNDFSSSPKSNKSIEFTSELSTITTLMNDSEIIDPLSQPFNPKIIAELIAKGLLDVINDRESMTLTIKLMCDPKSLSQEERLELKKFNEAILKELNQFKVENIISIDCVDITRSAEGDMLSLRITLPTLALYDAFIQRLANNLLPPQTMELKTKDKAEEAHHNTPTPFSMEPKYSNSLKSKDEEEQKTFNPSPFENKI